MPVAANAGQDGQPARAAVRALLAQEAQDAPVSWQDVQARTGLSRSRAYRLLRGERAHLAASNGHQPTLQPPRP
jgi:DNA-binding IclR family transcriptional regulator